MRRLYLLLALLNFHSFCFYAQTKQIDSLRKEIETAMEDTNKVKLANILSWELKNIGDYDEAMKCAGSALSLSQKLNYKDGIAVSYSRIGNIYFKQAIYSEALKLYSLSLEMNETIGSKLGIAKAYNNIGTVYSNQGNFPKSLEYYLKALKIAEEMEDKVMIGVLLINIGDYYYRIRNYSETLKKYFSALRIRNEGGDNRGIADCYNNIGNVYFNKGQLEQNQDSSKWLFKKSRENYQASLKILAEFGDQEGVAAVYNNIAGVFYYEKDIFSALENYFSSLKIREKIGDRRGVIISLVNIGSLHDDQGKSSEAMEYFIKALILAKELGELEYIQHTNLKLSDLYQKISNNEKSLEHYKAYIAARDSLLNEENTKKTVRLEMQYEFDKKEAATKLEQEKKEAIAAAEKKKQRIILLAISGFGLLVLGFALFAYRSFLQKKKANIEISRQKGLIEEKQKEILDSIRYARRIQRSLLTNEKYIAKNLSRLMS